MIHDLDKLLEQKLVPEAERLDGNARALKQAFRWMGKQSLLAVRVPIKFGGMGLVGADYHRFTATLQSYSAALGFLQKQHQSAGNQIAKGDQDQLKERLLPKMVTGRRSIEVSINHLRRADRPTVIAKPSKDGWLLSRTVP